MDKYSHMKRCYVREGLRELSFRKKRKNQPPNPNHNPNPGTVVDLTTKARKCDSQHFDGKSA